MNNVKRITIRDAVGEKLADLVNNIPDNGLLNVAVIMGIAMKVEQRQAQGGTFTYNLFKGDFKAVSHITGEEINAPSMYLPDPADTELEVQLNKGKSVEFGYLISIKAADNKYGYDIVTKRLINFGKDAFSSIEEKIGDEYLPKLKNNVKSKSKK